MSELLPISEDQRDAVQEVCNVAMGVAGEALAKLSGVFVEIPIPKIRYIKSQNVIEALAELRGNDRVSGVIQPYSFGSYEQFALLVITEAGLDDLAKQIGAPVDTNEQRIHILNRLCNTVTEACLPVIQEQLAVPQCVVQDVELVAHNVLLTDLNVPQLASFETLLSIENNYHLEGHPFNCDLLLLIPDESIVPLTELIDPLL
jgi:hypothetical protein